MRCSFNADCARLQHGRRVSYWPSIGEECDCPFPYAVAELKFAKCQPLFHQGDTAHGAFSLISGLVALERVDEDGQAVILKLLGPGSFFPCADLFTDGLHSATARAVTDATACFVPTERLLNGLAEPGLRRLVMQRTGEEARVNEDAIFRLCSGDLAERLLAVIQALAEEEPGEDGLLVRMPLAWREVATMLGTSPEVISRLLKRLGEAGRISVSGRAVRLMADREGRRATG